MYLLLQAVEPLSQRPPRCYTSFHRLLLGSGSSYQIRLSLTLAQLCCFYFHIISSFLSVGSLPDSCCFSLFLSCRCQLFVCPAGGLGGQFAPSSTCISWKEQVHHSSEVRSLLQCPSMVNGLLPLTVSTLAIPDDLRHIANHGEDWDPAYVIHLFPVVTLRNLLPYTVRYMMEVHLWTFSQGWGC